MHGHRAASLVFVIARLRYRSARLAPAHTVPPIVRRLHTYPHPHARTRTHAHSSSPLYLTHRTRTPALESRARLPSGPTPFPRAHALPGPLARPAHPRCPNASLPPASSAPSRGSAPALSRVRSVGPCSRLRACVRACMRVYPGAPTTRECEHAESQLDISIYHAAARGPCLPKNTPWSAFLLLFSSSPRLRPSLVPLTSLGAATPRPQRTARCSPPIDTRATYVCMQRCACDVRYAHGSRVRVEGREVRATSSAYTCGYSPIG